MKPPQRRARGYPRSHRGPFAFQLLIGDSSWWASQRESRIAMIRAVSCSRTALGFSKCICHLLSLLCLGMGLLHYLHHSTLRPVGQACQPGYLQRLMADSPSRQQRTTSLPRTTAGKSTAPASPSDREQPSCSSSRLNLRYCCPAL